LKITFVGYKDVTVKASNGMKVTLEENSTMLQGVEVVAYGVQKKVTVTGGAGFLGKAAVRQLEELGAYVRVIRSSEHDLRDAEQTADAVHGAEVVLHLAARVGGIGFNRRNPAPLAYDNTIMGTHIFEQSRLAGVQKLVAACSVCAYPKFTPVPFSEDSIWDGYPEESNAPYGLAKKMLIVLSDAYRRQYGFDSCAPIMANLYGPGQNLAKPQGLLSHVVRSHLLRRPIGRIDPIALGLQPDRGRDEDARRGQERRDRQPSRRHLKSLREKNSTESSSSPLT
jgi:nucleoside-diphosphate-sugar epimerase